MELTSDKLKTRIKGKYFNKKGTLKTAESVLV